MKGKKLVSLSMAAVMCAGGLAVYGGQEVKADDKVSVVVATNWGEGDSKYDYFYPVFRNSRKKMLIQWTLPFRHTALRITRRRSKPRQHPEIFPMYLHTGAAA